MKSLFLLPSLALVAFTGVSCQNGVKNPFASNPYYGPSSTGSSSSNASSYPGYSGDTYQPSNSGSSYSNPTATPPVPSYTGTTTDYGSSYSSPSSSASAPVPTSQGAGSGSSHTVAPGENLFRIGLKYGTTAQAIKNANGLSGDSIQAGQTLVIP